MSYRRSVWFIILIFVQDSFQNFTGRSLDDCKFKCLFDYLKKAVNHLAEEVPITSDSEGEEMQTRILNRKPNRYLNKGYKQSQSLYRPPCFDVACPVDDSYPM